MKKRSISALLALIMLVSVFSACAKKDSETNEGEGTAKDGIDAIDASYTIIRSDAADDVCVKSAAYLRTSILEKTGIDISLGTDYLKDGEKPADKEILVGKTNRETAFNRETLGEGEYYVGVEGQRLIIDAYDSLTLYVAINEVIEKWLILEEGNCMLGEELRSQLSTTVNTKELRIKVMTQNIRYADDGAGKNVADRAPRFKQLVDMYQPDIIGTQETTALWNKHYRNYFGNQYGMVGCSRDGRDASSGEWGTILYRLDRFELLDSDDFWLSRTPTVVSKIPASGCNRICTWALLKDKSTGKIFVMANTHLDYVNDEVRMEQLKYLYAGLSEMMAQYPIFITGDFNATPDSETYKTVIKDFLDPYKEAFENRSTVNHTADGYGTSGRDGGIIDYCFYNDKSTALWYKILNEQFGGYISDHFGVISEFIIK